MEKEKSEKEQSILEAIVKKGPDEIALLMQQIQEKQRNLEIAREALKLIHKETSNHEEQQQTISIPSIETQSTKYGNMTMPGAIKEILKSHDRFLSAKEIYEELIRNGFKSGSKNIMSDVYTRLNRAKKAKNGQLISREEDGVNKYSLPHGDEDLKRRSSVFAPSPVRPLQGGIFSASDGKS